MTLYNDSQKYEYSYVVKQYVGNLRYSSRFYPPIVYLSLLHSYWSIASVYAAKKLRYTEICRASR